MTRPLDATQYHKKLAGLTTISLSTPEEGAANLSLTPRSRSYGDICGKPRKSLAKLVY